VLLTLDVGLTTGYALFWENGVSEEHGEILLEDLLNRLVDIKLNWEITKCVVETPVIIRGQLGTQLQDAMGIVTKLFPNAHQIVAADWKQHPLSVAYVQSGTSQHEKDALRIGIWWLNK